MDNVLDVVMGLRDPKDDPNDRSAEFRRRQDMVGDVVEAQVEREEDAERRRELDRDQGVGELRPATVCRTNEGRGRGGRK